MCWFLRAMLSCFTLSLVTTTCIAQTTVISVGVPLHIVLDERTSYSKAGQPLCGHLSQPVYVFDHVALPAGTKVLGNVAEVHGVSKGKRFNALASGDFTPLREANVEFHTLVLSDGREIPIQSTGARHDSAVLRMASSSEHKGLWQQAKDGAKAEVSTKKRSLDPTGIQNLMRLMETGGTVKCATELNGIAIGHELDMRANLTDVTSSGLVTNISTLLLLAVPVNV